MIRTGNWSGGAWTNVFLEIFQTSWEILQVREKTHQVFWREIISYIVSRNTKECILETNLKEQG